MAIVSGDMFIDLTEPTFAPTLVGLGRPAVDAARAAGVLVEAVPDLGSAVGRVPAQAPTWVLEHASAHSA